VSRVYAVAHAVALLWLNTVRTLLLDTGLPGAPWPAGPQPCLKSQPPYTHSASRRSLSSHRCVPYDCNLVYLRQFISLQRLPCVMFLHPQHYQLFAALATLSFNACRPLLHLNDDVRVHLQIVEQDQSARGQSMTVTNRKLQIRCKPTGEVSPEAGWSQVTCYSLLRSCCILLHALSVYRRMFKLRAHVSSDRLLLSVTTRMSLQHAIDALLVVALLPFCLLTAYCPLAYCTLRWCGRSCLASPSTLLLWSSELATLCNVVVHFAGVNLSQLCTQDETCL
jgi:hypothetical protein